MIDSEVFFSFPAAVIGGVVFFVLLFFVLLFRLKHILLVHSETRRQETRMLDKTLQKTNKQLNELRSAVVGLGQKITEQEETVLHLNERVKDLEQQVQDTDSRLYSRASKLVQLGADVEELIEECELPKAEAELMLSLKKKISGEEKVPPLSKTHAREQQKARSAKKNV
ncbi:hypothetical protein VQ7734_01689 [Vibrio quintilis]|uniref:DUF2802 domain-containing protein n=2 Tax=Vibrio quintilis TaxID=1117707 RepID=A0A1M7YTM1_9VIBR|nr:DUF2802 domain-containing protein [Vibrio quintilis]SHO55928.1 hypothetical protein VQ7734_01689 [Vibrio quintilis]